MDIEFESQTALNSLCGAVMAMSQEERIKLAAAVQSAKPQYAYHRGEETARFGFVLHQENGVV